jgi:pantothenate kinase-related protein Tda10
MRHAHVCYQLFVVVAQFCEHFQRRNEIRIIVRNALQSADVADRAQGRATDFADTFGGRIGSGKNLVAMLIQQKMIVAKMRTRYMPMKVSSFSDTARTCQRAGYSVRPTDPALHSASGRSAYEAERSLF